MTTTEFERLEKAQILQSQMKYIDEIRKNLQRSDVFVTDMHIHYTTDAWGNKFELNRLPHDLVKNFMLDAFSRIRAQLENQFMHL